MTLDLKTLLLALTGIWLIDRVERSGLNPLDPSNWWKLSVIREAPRMGQAIGDVVNAGIADVKANPTTSYYDDGSYAK